MMFLPSEIGKDGVCAGSGRQMRRIDDSPWAWSLLRESSVEAETKPETGGGLDGLVEFGVVHDFVCWLFFVG